MHKNRFKLFLLGVLLPSSLFSVWQPADMRLVLPPKNPGRSIVFLPQMEHHIGYNSIDANGDGSTQNNLDSLLFGQTITIGDLSLASRLAAAEGLGTVATPTTTEANDEYLGGLSSATVEFNTKQKMFRLGVGGAMTFSRDLSGGVQWSFGFSMPFEYYEHIMDVVTTGGSLGTLDASGAGRFGASVLNVDLFFADHNDIDGYWKNDILTLKGLGDTETRRSLGIGSTRLYSTFHMNRESYRWLVSALLGIPTGSKPDGNVVWPIERGTSASAQLGFQADFQWNLGKKWQLFASGSMMKSFSTNLLMRVPKLNTSVAGTSLKAAGILANERFTGASGTAATDLVLKNTISAYDSLIPYFADNAISVKRRIGLVTQARAGFKYDAGPFDLNCWYDFYYRRKNRVRQNSKTPSGTYNYDTVMARTNQKRHTFGWRVEYRLNEQVNVGLGSTHVLKGRNTPKYHAACVNFTSIF